MIIMISSNATNIFIYCPLYDKTLEIDGKDEW